jgi:hypothetical protein
MAHLKNEATSKKMVVPIVVVALISGLIFGLVGAYIFARPGPQGIQGVQGAKGDAGLQGIQGMPGLNGTNTIQQMLVSQNLTSAILDSTYNSSQWYNLSIFDTSMRTTLTINDQSRILAEFATTISLSNSAIWFRIVVDNQYISTVCRASTSPNMDLPIYVKILTGSLSAGQHVIEVEFYRVNGITTVLDRSIYMTELPAASTG